MSYLKRREKIYQQHLKQIKEKHFTLREIDVMSCMIHNRKQQKIASLLSIAPKTVNTHLYNIVNKLGHNSISIIIDFAERSGKLQYFREYYYYLIMQSLFEQYLKKAAIVSKHKHITCNVFIQNSEASQKAFSALADSLKNTNIKLFTKSHNTPSQLTDDKSAKIFNVHILTEKVSVMPPGEKSVEDIVLLFNDSDLSGLTRYKYVDFRKEEEFYNAIFKFLDILINTQETSKLLREYDKERSLMEKSWHEMLHLPSSEIRSRSISKNKITLLALTFIVLVTLGIVTYFKLSKKYATQKVSSINKHCGEFIDKYSFENIGVTEGLKKNLNLLNIIDQNLSNIDHKDIQNYLVNYSSSPKELLNYLYSIQALSMHLLYNNYNVQRSRQLLLNAKNTVESYINNRSNVKVDFNKSCPEEIYTEISVINELPQIYSKILYLLGRTYTYFEEVRIGDSKADEMNYEDYERYYEIAAHIGTKTKIFEGYLSKRNLAEMVNLFKINRKIKNIKNYELESIINDIYDLIKTLDQLKADNNEYLLNYRAYLVKPEIIIPSKDNYNKSYLTERILQHYSRLLKITNNKDQKLRYVDEIARYFTGDTNILSVFDEIDGVPSKKVACLYNSIGFLLLQFLEQNVESAKLHKALKEKLLLTGEDQLDHIIQIFEAAKTKSRNSHYPKLHSCRGLVRTYEYILINLPLQDSERSKIKNLIVDYQYKIEEIDQQLKKSM